MMAASAVLATEDKILLAEDPPDLVEYNHPNEEMR